MTLIQKPVPVEGVMVGVVRLAINRHDWPQVLPAWLVAEIRACRVAVGWDQIHVSAFHGGGGHKVEADDWIIRQPDGRITTCSAAARAALYEMVS
jgi:hypothetical protein